MTAHQIIIDTDPGQDDAVAILMALASPEIKVLGLTAVAGNVPLDLTQKNARRICELADRSDVSVMAGCDRPLTGKLVTAEHVHGETGLDGLEWPSPTMPLSETHAVDWLVQTIMAAPPQTVTLCPVGPLTNVGLAIAREPNIATRLKAIVLMGGGFFEGGNITPTAEFNIYVDPVAAKIVFESGASLVMAPLDCTHTASYTKAWREKLATIDNRVARGVAKMLAFYEDFDRRRTKEDWAPLHDPCVIAYLLRPELFESRDCAVQIVTTPGETFGMTVVDWWGVREQPANCKVLRRVDRDAFLDLIFELMERYQKLT
ncbi:MAG: nucleoside hydrolase [Pseudomonadota bacterium]